MNKARILTIAACSLASCDSPRENAQEMAADRVEAAGERVEDQADSMRRRADATDPR